MDGPTPQRALRKVPPALKVEIPIYRPKLQATAGSTQTLSSEPEYRHPSLEIPAGPGMIATERPVIQPSKFSRNVLRKPLPNRSREHLPMAMTIGRPAKRHFSVRRHVVRFIPRSLRRLCALISRRRTRESLGRLISEPMDPVHLVGAGAVKIFRAKELRRASTPLSQHPITIVSAPSSAPSTSNDPIPGPRPARTRLYPAPAILPPPPLPKITVTSPAGMTVSPRLSIATSPSKTQFSSSPEAKFLDISKRQQWLERELEAKIHHIQSLEDELEERRATTSRDHAFADHWKRLYERESQLKRGDEERVIEAEPELEPAEEEAPPPAPVRPSRFRFGSGTRIEARPAVFRVPIESTQEIEPVSADWAGRLDTWEWSSVPDLGLANPVVEERKRKRKGAFW